LTAAPDSTDARLQALRRFFLLRYHEAIQRGYLAFRDLFPLVGGSRLDLVRINGGHRVHFVYRGGHSGEHLVVVHDLTIEVGDAEEATERRFVRWALAIDDPLAHFIVRPPYEEAFDQVEREALAAVDRHAKLRPSLRHSQN
jgi:hypothetical protein